MPLKRLKRSELPNETVALAKALIGLVFVRQSPHGRTAGKIVEVEAYLSGNDPASHAHRGETRRNASMFLAAFHAYIYKIYGTSFCVNVSSNEAGIGEAILIRALEPLDGLPLMMQRRGTEVVRDLCRGPGRLCQALAIDRGLDGVDLLKSPELWIADGGLKSGAVRKSKRIGITKAADRHLRFYEAGSPHLSGPRHLSP
ncbi:MAG: DNA-3-methyladenine glycosylase [Candidatus Baltobacteraceae bacterium]